MCSPLRSQKNHCAHEMCYLLNCHLPNATMVILELIFINQAFDLPSFFKHICFGFKLQRAAHVHNISSICCSNETGRLFFSILKLLIQLIARSTWILRLATSLIFFNLSKSHLTFHWRTWWDFKATDMKELFFFNLKASSCHYLIASFQNIVFSYVFV